MIRTLNNATNISKNQQSPLILTEFTEYKKTTTCHVGNAGADLGQAQNSMLGLEIYFPFAR
jgi:hypothetical protein